MVTMNNLKKIVESVNDQTVINEFVEYSKTLKNINEINHIFSKLSDIILEFTNAPNDSETYEQRMERLKRELENPKTPKQSPTKIGLKQIASAIFRASNDDPEKASLLLKKVHNEVNMLYLTHSKWRYNADADLTYQNPE